MTAYFSVLNVYFYPILAMGPQYRVLGSHHLIHTENALHRWQDVYRSKHENTFFLDSGAFSVYNSGLPLINIRDYIKTIDTLKPMVYASMDVIGDAQASYDNTRFLWSEGYNALPVIHAASTDDEIRRFTRLYLDEHGCRHIAFGGVATSAHGRNEPRRKVALFWTIVRKYWPVRVHLFGKFAANWLLDYPYHSADSSTWMTAARFGYIKTIKSHLDSTMKQTVHSTPLIGRTNKYELFFRNQTLPKNIIVEPGFLEGKQPEEIRGYIKRCLVQALVYKELIERITDYWTARGVVWNPVPESNAKPPIKWTNHKATKNV